MTNNNRVAILFPGQGSQTVGMLSNAASQIDSVLQTFNKASEILGYDLWQLVTENPNNQLHQTEFTQPALLVSGVALWQVWESFHKDANIAAMAGHSLGEYTALVCAESILFEEAVLLVKRRGQCMQAAVPEGIGAMAAIIGLEDDVVADICEEIAGDEVLAPANYNAIGQVVIAGHQAAVERGIVAMKKAGAKLAKILPISVPSHCLLMKEAAQDFDKILQETTIVAPKVQIIHNADAKSYQHPEQIRDALARQLYNPVRWVDTIKLLQSLQVTRCYECGPGNVLTGLCKRITRSIECIAYEKAIQDKHLLHE